MKQTVLEGREALKKEIDKIAEVAGYLWQNGWAERNGGNITVNITELVDEEIKTLPAISDVKQIGVTLPALKGCYFFAKAQVSVCVILLVSLWITEVLSAFWTIVQVM